MMNVRHKEVLKSSTSKRAESLASDADHGDSDYGSSYSSEDLNFRGFTEEETKTLSSMITKKVGKAELLIQLLTQDGLPPSKVPFVLVVVKKRIKLILPQFFFVKVLRFGGKENFVKRAKNGCSCAHEKISRICLKLNMLQLRKSKKIKEEFQSLMQTNKSVNEL
nr:zinc finger, CCHC-type, retrotransposon Gag domain protein [Tanacetum cinerariifolium]